MLLRQLDENWYLGEVNGITGVFPASSVQVIKQLPLPAPLGRALYGFELRSRDKAGNADCLTFHKVTEGGRSRLAGGGGSSVHCSLPRRSSLWDSRGSQAPQTLLPVVNPTLTAPRAHRARC